MARTMLLTWILLLFTLLVLDNVPVSGQVVVGSPVKALLNQGPIVGFKDQTERGSFFNSFLGIPYALPPVGELRFKDPVPHPGWVERELVADKFGPSCPQFDGNTGNVIGDEDCLTLNVYTPLMPNGKYNVQPMPVMFYVHGGAFRRGGSSVHGAAKLLGEDVVLVTINYRLGILGFLCTEDEWGPGNYGLMDIVLSLHWVRENIAVFNGDPRRVTVFGESAGAALVSMLTLSPLARGLFWMAITQSGSALCDWSVVEEPNSYAISVSSRLGCAIQSGAHVIECLRRQSIEEIVRVQQSEMKISYFPLMTAPVVDRGFRPKPFLPDTPEVLMTGGNFSHVPLITGVVTHEGILFALRILLTSATEIGNNPHYFQDVVLPMTVEYATDHLYTPEKMAKIKSFYFRDVDMTNMDQVFPQFVDLFSDMMFFECNDRTIKLHSRYAPVYSYVFSHRGNQSYAQGLIEAASKINMRSNLLYTGVSHADDLQYLFNLPNVDATYKYPMDVQVQNLMVSLWTTFAQYGTPNRPGSGGTDQPVLFWSNARESEMIYLDITVYAKVGRDFRVFELSVFEYINLTPPPSPQPYVTDTERPYYIATWVLLAMVGLLIIAAIVMAVLLVRAQNRRSYSTNELPIDPYG